MSRTIDNHRTALETLEARFGARIAAGLSERTATVPHDVSERLRVGRERAMARAKRTPAPFAVTASAVIGSSRHGAALLGGPPRFWLQLAAWMPLAVLIAGLVLIQQWSDREQVLAAAEIDSVLLADDLPPTAWTDPGFREYLKAPPP